MCEMTEAGKGEKMDMETQLETIHLYDQDAYQTEFSAKVLSCEVNRKNETLYDVVLDQTVFFPEEGGQSPDKGELNGIQVVDVQICDGIIYHTLEKPLKVGEVVKGEIDWQHRFNNMQQHSGEHIFSGIVHRKYGYNNVGFHLSNQIVTMDFDGVLTETQMEEIEWEVNEVITKNMMISTFFPTKEELKNIEYRSKKEIEGQVRLVVIGDVDVCACCAPHVKQTGEIGLFKVMQMQNYKGGVRISFLCGFRAIMAFRKKAEVVSSLMNCFSTNQEALTENVEKLKSTNQNLKFQLACTKQALLSYKTKEIPAEQENVFLFEEELETTVVRNLINELVEKHIGICGVFSGNGEAGYNYIIGSKTKDCKEIATLLREKLGARGGGSSAMIQGYVKAKEEEIKQFIENVCACY